MSYFNSTEQHEQRPTCILQNLIIQAIDHKQCNFFFYYDSFLKILYYTDLKIWKLFYFALCNMMVILCLTVDNTESVVDCAYIDRWQTQTRQQLPAVIY